MGGVDDSQARADDPAVHVAGRDSQSVPVQTSLAAAVLTTSEIGTETASESIMMTRSPQTQVLPVLIFVAALLTMTSRLGVVAGANTGKVVVVLLIIFFSVLTFQPSSRSERSPDDSGVWSMTMWQHVSTDRCDEVASIAGLVQQDPHAPPTGSNHPPHFAFPSCYISTWFAGNVPCTTDQGAEASMRCPSKCASEAPPPTEAKRVRRKLTSLSDAEWQRVVDALWVMKNLTTSEGQARYGPGFREFDFFAYLHILSQFVPFDGTGAGVERAQEPPSAAGSHNSARFIRTVSPRRR